jgi:hypothetical protein
MLFTVDQLAEARVQRSRTNHETYKNIYQTCIEHVRGRHAAGCTMAVFAVPQHVVGRPPFEHEHAIRYVSEKLRKGRFHVGVHDSFLVIDWGKAAAKATELKARQPSSSGHPKNAPKKKNSEEPLSARLERLVKSIK